MVFAVTVVPTAPPNTINLEDRLLKTNEQTNRIMFNIYYLTEISDKYLKTGLGLHSQHH